MITLERLEADSERYYQRSDTGEIVPSVTTVLGVVPKPFMIPWTMKLAASYAVDNLGVLVGIDPDEAVNDVLCAADEKRWEGARKGTAVHEYAENLLTLGLAEPPTNRAEESVCEILEILAPEILHTEGRIWNGEHGYAGTLDGLWRVGGETWLVDWKTSKSRSVDWVLQQDAYRRAETIVTAGGDEIPMPHVDRLMVLWTRFDHPWQIVPVTPRAEDWETFLACKQVLQWQRATGVRDVFGVTEHKQNGDR